jgi:hypothetical protein
MKNQIEFVNPFQDIINVFIEKYGQKPCYIQFVPIEKKEGEKVSLGYVDLEEDEDGHKTCYVNINCNMSLFGMMESLVQGLASCERGAEEQDEQWLAIYTSIYEAYNAEIKRRSDLVGGSVVEVTAGRPSKN